MTFFIGTAPGYAASGGLGYGAGGGGGGTTNTITPGGSFYAGGNGAIDLDYIEWD